MELKSPAFAPSGEIPRQHTCEGQDVSPALSWSGVPAAAKSLALVVDDPDAPDPAAPRMTWVHWVVFNIPPAASGLAAAGEPLPRGAVEGRNDFGRAGYGGPCPPVGRHRYFFRLYALDTTLPPTREATRAQVDRAMKGHVLAQAELVGTYQKARR